MSAPTDPLGPVFDFGLTFQSASERIKGEREERKQLAARELRYFVPFLDDILRGILPHDLILLGARSGAGKTELAINIALANVRAGKTVKYFALEGEPKEIERRNKYKLLAELAFRARRDLSELNYPDWYRDRCEHIVGDFNDDVERLMQKQLSTLHTYYRGSSFGHDDLRRLLLAHQTDADLFVIDHLHYIDIDDENTNRGFTLLMKMIRDIALGMGRPILLVVHIRKPDPKDKSLTPDMDAIHGSSDIFKVATHSIMLAPARGQPSKANYLANTFIAVPKDRMGGGTGLVALCRFDLRFRTYESTYTLGRPNYGTGKFEPLDLTDVPRWAKGHVPLHQPVAATTPAAAAALEQGAA